MNHIYNRRLALRRYCRCCQACYSLENMASLFICEQRNPIGHMVDDVTSSGLAVVKVVNVEDNAKRNQLFFLICLIITRYLPMTFVFRGGQKGVGNVIAEHGASVIRQRLSESWGKIPIIIFSSFAFAQLSEVKGKLKGS